MYTMIMLYNDEWVALGTRHVPEGLRALRSRHDRANTFFV